MTTNINFVLSYDFINVLLPLDKVDIFAMKIYIVAADVANDVTKMHEYERGKIKDLCSF